MQQDTLSLIITIILIAGVVIVGIILFGIILILAIRLSLKIVNSNTMQKLSDGYWDSYVLKYKITNSKTYFQKNYLNPTLIFASPSGLQFDIDSVSTGKPLYRHYTYFTVQTNCRFDLKIIRKSTANFFMSFYSNLKASSTEVNKKFYIVGTKSSSVDECLRSDKLISLLKKYSADYLFMVHYYQKESVERQDSQYVLTVAFDKSYYPQDKSVEELQSLLGQIEDLANLDCR